MHDIRAIRANPAAFDAAMARRGLPSASPEILALDTERRAALTALQDKQARRNALSREIGQQKRAGADTAALEAEAIALRGEMEGLERAPPNSTPRPGASWNRCPTSWTRTCPTAPTKPPTSCWRSTAQPRDLGFQPKQHFELGEALGLMDFATAAKLAGARFVVLRGALARLERALGQFMLDLHTARAWLYRDGRAVAGERRRRLWHRQPAEIRRRLVPHHRRPLADPHRRGAADATPSRARSSRRRTCRSA